jgi:hypothetical protein
VRLLRLVPIVVLVLWLTACGSANDVTNLITSTPDTAALAVAEANASAAATVVETYRATHGGYDGATTDALRQLDPSLSSSVTVVATATGYCIQSVIRDVTASLRGPGGTAQAGSCS